MFTKAFVCLLLISTALAAQKEKDVQENLARAAGITNNFPNGVMSSPAESVPWWWNMLMEILRTRLNQFVDLLDQNIHNAGVSETCFNDTKYYMEGLMASAPWAIQMLDSFGKPPTGIMEGNLMWLGTFYQCMDTTATRNNTETLEIENVFGGKPCLATVLTNITTKNPLLPRVAVKLGTCMPNTCEDSETKTLMEVVLMTMFELAKQNATVHVVDSTCKVPLEDVEWKPNAIAMLTVVVIFAVLILLGTVYDLYLEYFKKEIEELIVNTDDTMNDGVANGNIDEEANKPQTKKTAEPLPPNNSEKFFLAFSAYTNGKKILSMEQSPNALTCLNGIRTFSMTWVVLGHSVSLFISTFANSFKTFADYPMRFSFQPIYNATVSVDSFFVMSGLLTAYLFFGELRKLGSLKKVKWPLFYFHRYWRLTPVYMIVVGIYTALLVHMGNGPMWLDQKSEGDEACRKYWWRNLVYINNFWPVTELCAGWSWYLSNDMQFYVISPLFFIALAWKPVVGLTLMGTGILGCLIARGVFSSTHNYSIYMGEMMGDAFLYMYEAPWMRIGAYFCGTITGYLLHVFRGNLKLPKWSVVLGWAMAAFFCLMVIYGPYDAETQKVTISNDLAAFYNSTHRFVWSVGLCWVIFACVTGYGGIINTFLSWKGFLPSARLTYCCYLIHIIVMTTFFQSRTALIYYDDYYLVVFYLAILVLTYAAAFVTSVAFESPFMALEKIFLKK